MDPVTATNTSPVPQAQSDQTSGTTISSDFETFLKMLTVQMENQDPLNPTDSSEYAMQLATFSGVEQAVLTNDLLESLTAQMQTADLAQMASWVGREARAATPAYFDGSPITIAPVADSFADRAELVVTDRNGTEVSRAPLPIPATQMDWDGAGANGAVLADGLYQLSVASYSGEDLINERPVEVYATIQEVRSQNGQTTLLMPGGIEVAANQVTALRLGAS